MRRPRGGLGSIAAKRRHRLPVFRSPAGPGRGPGTQTIRMPLGTMPVACHWQCKRPRSLALGYDGNHHVRMTIFFFARAPSDRGRSEALCGPKGPACRNLIPFFQFPLGRSPGRFGFGFVLSRRHYRRSNFRFSVFSLTEASAGWESRPRRGKGCGLRSF